MDKIGKNRLGSVCRGILYVIMSASVTQREGYGTAVRTAATETTVDPQGQPGKDLWQTPPAVSTRPLHAPSARSLPASGPLCRHLSPAAWAHSLGAGTSPA